MIGRRRLISHRGQDGTFSVVAGSRGAYHARLSLRLNLRYNPYWGGCQRPIPRESDKDQIARSPGMEGGAWALVGLAVFKTADEPHGPWWVRFPLPSATLARVNQDV